MELAYDEVIGHYDPNVEYCVEDGCKNRAVDMEWTGMNNVEVDSDMACAVHEFKCQEHLGLTV